MGKYREEIKRLAAITLSMLVGGLEILLGY